MTNPCNATRIEIIETLQAQIKDQASEIDALLADNSRLARENKMLQDDLRRHRHERELQNRTWGE